MGRHLQFLQFPEAPTGSDFGHNWHGKLLKWARFHAVFYENNSFIEPIFRDFEHQFIVDLEQRT